MKTTILLFALSLSLNLHSNFNEDTITTIKIIELSTTAKTNKIPFIKQLKNGEEYLIAIHASGCFYQFDDEITIYKQ